LIETTDQLVIYYRYLSYVYRSAKFFNFFAHLFILPFTDLRNFTYRKKFLF